MKNKKQSAYDLVIGIPSYNNASTISYVVEIIDRGLKKYFPSQKSLILNVDGGSRDSTRKKFGGTKVSKNVFLESKKYEVISGKGFALKKIFETALEYQPMACMTIDADLKSISPEWIRNLLSPIINKGYDLVTPIYSRNKFDGTITKNLAFPLTTVLYGKKILQPIGGDFGFSAKIANAYLEKNVWETDVAKFGIDIFMTTTAVAENFKVCQVFLGTKIHDPKDPRGLGPMFAQVSSAIFSLMKNYESAWKENKTLKMVPIFFNKKEEQVEGNILVNPESLISEFRSKFKKYKYYYSHILYQSHLEVLEKLAKEKDIKNFRLPLDLWAKLVYDFAVEANESAIDKKFLYDAFTTLYFAQVASYILTAQDLNNKDAEKYVEKIIEAFQTNKTYLFRRWRGLKPLVEEWFSKNNFHYSDFANIHRLVKRKENKRLTIGLCLPAKNEAATIGKIIDILKPLKEKDGLLDEIIVMDSNSTDETAKIAKSKKIPVFQSNEVLSNHNIKLQWGKGNNLWKSLYVLNTDIIIWIDTDIENMHPLFVYGLIGPLLERDDLGFVKGYYQRPLKLGNTLQSTGGGRVTELCVRPLLNTFYPNLSRILQPLSGEYAGRREIFEQIPFCANYALETCMLIDIYSKFGLDIIGQTDLKIRIHRNQPLAALSKLSFGIMQSVFNRLHLYGKIRLLEEPVMKEGRYKFEKIQIIEEQYMPIIEIPEYNEKFKNREIKWHIPKK
jgi:glycosyltransferase involved in cell wall biosynthesis